MRWTGIASSFVLVGCHHASATTHSSDAATPVAASASPSVNPRCAASCAAGFCWDDCPMRTIAPRGDIDAVAVAEDSVAWTDKRGAHWWRHGAVTDYPGGYPPLAVKGDRLVFNVSKRGVSIVRGGAAPRIVALPRCDSGVDVILGDGRMAFRCDHSVTDNSGGPGLGAILSILTDFTVADDDGKVLGTEEFAKSPNADSMNAVFAMRGEHVITNDNERIVEVDLVTKKPLLQVLGSLPEGYLVIHGVEHGAGFDLCAWNCTGHEWLACPGEVAGNLVHVEGKRVTETIPIPNAAVSPLAIHGSARVLHDDQTIYREADGKFAALATVTTGLTDVAVAADGTSAVITNDGLVVRARAAW